jgi:hypothetical protein
MLARIWIALCGVLIFFVGRRHAKDSFPWLFLACFGLLIAAGTFLLMSLEEFKEHPELLTLLFLGIGYFVGLTLKPLGILIKFSFWPLIPWVFTSVFFQVLLCGFVLVLLRNPVLGMLPMCFSGYLWGLRNKVNPRW